MATSRMVSTVFWTDSFVQELTASEKLLFLYLLTNTHTEICGIYEVSIKTIAFESGLDQKTVLKAMDTLSKANKISYADNWVFIKNFTKHQQKNPKVEAGIERGVSRVPKAILDRLYIDYDSLSHLTILNLTIPNSTLPNGGACKTEKETQLEKTLRLFEIIWSPYPKHRNKGQARKAFEKIKNPPIEKMLSTIARMKESPDWKKENGKYIPYLSTWLNAEGWEDEAEVELVKDDDYYINEMKEIEFHKFRKKYGDELAQKYLNHSQI